jgi:menaquinone-dependent protoporphyrinogen oxidase
MEEMTRRRFLVLGGVAVGAAALGGAGYAATWAPEVRQPSDSMGAGMNSVLVVYGTGSGCTAGVAERIGAAVAARGVKVDVVPAKDAPDPSGYDAVFVGSGVRAGNWHAPVKEWVTRNASTLGTGKLAFFTVGLTLATDPGKTEEVRAYTDALIAESGVTPSDVGLFAGWNEPKRFSFIERTIMKLMKTPEGDFRDWASIDAWATKTATALGVVG